MPLVDVNGNVIDAFVFPSGKQVVRNGTELVGVDAQSPVALIAPYAPGTFVVPDGHYALVVKRLHLTGTQRCTLLGSARLRII